MQQFNPKHPVQSNIQSEKLNNEQLSLVSLLADYMNASTDPDHKQRISNRIDEILGIQRPVANQGGNA